METKYMVFVLSEKCGENEELIGELLLRGENTAQRSLYVYIYRESIKTGNTVYLAKRTGHLKMHNS